MKERPILFNGEMVRAILDGRKTQTRRPVNKLLSSNFAAPVWSFGEGHHGLGWYISEADYPEEGSIFIQGPFGQPGDRLWVRETWAPMCRVADPQCWCDTVDDDGNELPYLSHPEHYIEYRADTGNKRPGDWPDPEDGDFEDAPRWRPSIHMPRWASRIMLKITGVRTERLKDLTIQDAFAEGRTLSTSRESETDFQNTWDAIYHAQGCGWDANPWVWVVEFKRVSP